MTESFAPGAGTFGPASPEVDTHEVLLCESTRGSLGSPRRSRPGLFPSPAFDLLRLAFPRHLLQRRAHPFVSFSSSEFLRSCSSLGLTFRSELHPASGLVPSSRPHLGAATFRAGSQSALRCVLRLSQPLDALLRSEARRLISSRCHVQDSLVQGLLSPRSHPSSSEGACPQAVGPRTTHPLAQAAVVRGPRLRGLHLREAAFSAPQLFTAKRAAPLFEFFSSRPSFSYGEAPAYPEPSALDVHSLGLRLRARPKSSSPASSPRRTRRDRLRSRLPARDFEPTARILVFDSPRLAVARSTICFDHQRFRR